MKGGGGGYRKAHRDYSQSIQTGGVKGSGGNTNECTISIIVILVKTQPPISGVGVGDILSVGLEGGSVAVYNDSGEICGYIGSTAMLSRIIRCIESGVIYIAEVTECSGTRYSVRLKNK